MAIRRSKQRTAVRALKRRHEKLIRAREQLFEAQRGGSARRPIEVASASTVETQALSLHCPRCDVAMSCEEHWARTVDDVRLREVVLRCQLCGQRRSAWFYIVPRDN